MDLSDERASARTGEVCPGHFRRIAAAIDEAERVAWDRIGGPTDAECGAIRRLEAKLPEPGVADEWEWFARRLARGIENGWHGGAVSTLLKRAG